MAWNKIRPPTISRHEWRYDATLHARSAGDPWQDFEHRLDRGLSTRPLHGRVLRQQGFCAQLLGSYRLRVQGTGATVMAFCPDPTASGFQDKAAMQDSGLVKGKTMPSSESVAAGYRARCNEVNASTCRVS